MSVTTQGVDFTEIARFNISATGNPTVAPGDPLPPPDENFIGVAATAMAWNGSKLYIAGYNNSGTAPPSVNAVTSIIEITNATATGLVSPTYSSLISTQITPAGRGYTGLDLNADGTRLAASFSDGFANTSPEGPAVDGLQLFDTSDNSRLWSYAERGDSGVAFDPGFPGGNPAQGTGVAYVESFGSGRRSLIDATTGADIWTPANGMIWIPTGGTAGNTRDITFDPDTGDMYIRSNNDLFFAKRTGDNTTDQAQNLKIVDNTDAPFVNFQHLAFLNTTNDGDLVIYNNRAVGATGQDFFTVNQLVSSTGVSQAMNFTFLPNADTTAFLPGTSAGWYDYDFDPATQTLAILDTSSALIHIFQVGSQSGLPGDLNDDGVVTGRDFLDWQRGDTSPAFDANALAEWQGAYNGGALTALSAVPEPSSLTMIAAAVACLAGLKRNGR
jgi:hypothetical protein